MEDPQRIWGGDEITNSQRSVEYALIKTRSLSLSSSENQWVSKIESLRKEIELSEDEISMVDYGAGSNVLDTEGNLSLTKTRIVGELCRATSKKYKWAVLLFNLIREFKPLTCLELGTCLGVSAAFEAAALKLNKKGQLITIEGSNSLAEIARQNFRKLKLDNVRVEIGTFQDKLDSIFADMETINYAFIDGHHDEGPTVKYFDMIFPHLSSPAVVIFDDIAWSEGMKRAWNRLKKDNRLDITIDLGNVGVCLVDNKAAESKNFDLSTYLC